MKALGAEITVDAGYVLGKCVSGLLAPRFFLNRQPSVEQKTS